MMSRARPDLLEALRLPTLYREICLYAGVALPPAPALAPGFLLRCGTEPPEFFVKLLQEAFAEEGAEVDVRHQAEHPDLCWPGPGKVLVLPGYDSPCPATDALRQALRSGTDKALLFALERHAASGVLLDVTWAAVPESEPPPQAAFRAAVLRKEYALPT